MLRLSDEAIELADRHNLDEFTLRPVLQLAQDTHAEMFQHIIRFALTGRQVRDIVERGMDDEPSNPTDATSPHVRSFVKSMQKMNDNDEKDFIRDLMSQESNVQMARARIESTISFLMRIRNQLSDE